MGKRLDNGKLRRVRVPPVAPPAPEPPPKVVPKLVPWWAREPRNQPSLQGWRKVEALKGCQELGDYLGINLGVTLLPLDVKSMHGDGKYLGFKVKDPKPISEKGDIYRVWHGTSLVALRGILHYGFRESQSGMLGSGVYVGEWQKANNYQRSSGKALVKFQGKYYFVGSGVMLLCRANLGRVRTIRNPTAGALIQGVDTLAGGAGYTKSWSGSLHHHEWCVRDPSRLSVVEIHLRADVQDV